MIKVFTGAIRSAQMNSQNRDACGITRAGRILHVMATHITPKTMHDHKQRIRRRRMQSPRQTHAPDIRIPVRRASGAAMNQGYCFGQPRILFWECIGDDGVPDAPRWIQGWWDVNDGNQWYYHFSSQFVVSYMTAKPNGPFDMPALRYGSQGILRQTAPSLPAPHQQRRLHMLLS